jgi:hypothetical protein
VFKTEPRGYLLKAIEPKEGPEKVAMGGFCVALTSSQGRQGSIGCAMESGVRSFRLRALPIRDGLADDQRDSPTGKKIQPTNAALAHLVPTVQERHWSAEQHFEPPSSSP